MQLFENFTLVQQVVTTFQTIHLQASGRFGAVQVVVPFRTFVSTIIAVVVASNFGIYTIGVIILPAGGTPGVACQPDCRLDEASSKKQVGGRREWPHFIAVDLWLELAHKGQYEHEDNTTGPSKSVTGFCRSTPPPPFIL